MKLKKQQHTEGIITIEALISIPVILSVFACFVFLFSYMTTVLTLKKDLSDKACELAVSDYAFFTSFPSVLSLYDKNEREKMNLLYVFCYSETFGDDITLFLDCKYNGIIKKVNIHLSQKISKWKGDGINFSDVNVWTLSNAERGAAIEALYGGNLPAFFPVIDSYNEFTGTVTMISSIDTTYERYNNRDMFYDRIMEDISRMMSFTGASYGEVNIRSDYIENKQVILVFPTNPLNRMQLTVVEEVKRICEANDIQLLIKRYQLSSSNQISN
ncbi:MAG: hypothetical protein JXQ23_04585 [Clostridia bacterium]|nr:hypothetical protein [Clostridia bacterium]